MKVICNATFLVRVFIFISWRLYVFRLCSPAGDYILEKTSLLLEAARTCDCYHVLLEENIFRCKVLKSLLWPWDISVEWPFRFPCYVMQTLSGWGERICGAEDMLPPPRYPSGWFIRSLRSPLAFAEIFRKTDLIWYIVMWEIQWRLCYCVRVRIQPKFYLGLFVCEMRKKISYHNTA
jgi:hypothetical protein